MFQEPAWNELPTSSNLRTTELSCRELTALPGGMLHHPEGKPRAQRAVQV